MLWRSFGLLNRIAPEDRSKALRWHLGEVRQPAAGHHRRRQSSAPFHSCSRAEPSRPGHSLRPATFQSADGATCDDIFSALRFRFPFSVITLDALGVPHKTQQTSIPFHKCEQPPNSNNLNRIAHSSKNEDRTYLSARIYMYWFLAAAFWCRTRYVKVVRPRIDTTSR